MANQRQRKPAYYLSALIAGGWLVLYGGLAIAYPSGTYGSGSYGACGYGDSCSISVTSNGNVSLNVTPTASGSCTIQNDNVAVLTDDTNGYTLTVADNSTNTALINGAMTISASPSTIANPAALAINSWGYRVDSLGSFGGGPTTSQSNVSPGSTLFAGIKANDQPADTIASVSGAADPAITTTVWFGACANTNVTSGSYTTQVLYTAVAN